MELHRKLGEMRVVFGDEGSSSYAISILEDGRIHLGR
jgi:hypothetical protein